LPQRAPLHVAALMRATAPATGLRPGPGTPLRLEHPPRRSRVGRKLRRRPDRPGHQVAAAVRTASAEPPIGAVAAEGALERADHGIGRCGRQILVAAFAVWSQLEHLLPNPCL
jgi:hypothetical protein